MRSLGLHSFALPLLGLPAFGILAHGGGGVTPPVSDYGAILLEDGGRILTEDGGAILMEDQTAVMLTESGGVILTEDNGRIMIENQL